MLNWARGEYGFNVPESQRSGLGLFVRDSKEPPDVAEHIGDLATKDHHVHLTLASAKRPPG